MRPPLEYGDNFPVPTGVWNPAEPWRFPRHELLPSRQGFLNRALPWITLGLGISLGILWMSWRTELVGMKPNGDGEALRTRTPATVSPGGSVQFQMRSRLV